MNAYVGVGGNLGSRAEIILRFQQTAEKLEARRASRVYRSEPVGPVADQPQFLNAVLEIAAVERVVDVRELLSRLQSLETELGRDRSGEVRFGPRSIDLDLLLVGELEVATEELALPHPRLTQRAFVLRPLAELVGEDYALPGGRRIGECLAEPDVAAQVTEVITGVALRL